MGSEAGSEDYESVFNSRFHHYIGYQYTDVAFMICRHKDEGHTSFLFYPPSEAPGINKNINPLFLNYICHCSPAGTIFGKR
jgi:hypothetical protein